jgi:hypothetical protein
MFDKDIKLVSLFISTLNLRIGSSGIQQLIFSNYL